MNTPETYALRGLVPDSMIPRLYALRDTLAGYIGEPLSVLVVLAFRQWYQSYNPSFLSKLDYPDPPTDSELLQWWNLFVRTAEEAPLGSIRPSEQYPEPNRVLWVLQAEGFRGDHNTSLLKEVLTERGIPWVEVPLRPSSGDPEEDRIDIPGYESGIQLMFYGSTTFRDRLAADPRWQLHLQHRPDLYTLQGLRRLWGPMTLLNGEARVMTAQAFLDEVGDDDEDLFVRPNGDTKSLVGAVQTRRQWRDAIRISMNNVRGPEADTEILVNTPQNLVRECRFFLVMDNPVAASTYRLHGYPNTREPVPVKMWEWVRDHKPHRRAPRCVTLDVCETTDGEYLIVEANTFQCSGFYEAHLPSIVRAIQGTLLWVTRLP